MLNQIQIRELLKELSSRCNCSFNRFWQQVKDAEGGNIQRQVIIEQCHTLEIDDLRDSEIIDLLEKHLS